MRSRTVLLTMLFLLFTLPGVRAQPPVQDICFGNGTTGPFPLTWNHIAVGTESVTVNGLPQMRGLDYTLDADNGTITFALALPTRSVATVSYETDPTLAQPNSSPRTIPLSVDLIRSEHGYFSFNALGKQDQTVGSDLTLGLGMGWQGRHDTQITSHFYYTPVTLASDTNADTMDKRIGLSLAASTGAGNWGLFAFGFSHAGVGLENAGDDSLRAGQQRLTLSSRLTPTKTVQAQVNFSQSNSTDDPGAAATTNSSLALTMTPNAKMQVAASLGQNETGASGTTQTVGLSVDSHPTTKMEVSATYGGQNAPGVASDSQTISLKTVLTPGKTLSVQTSAGQSKLGAAITDQQAVLLSLDPRATVHLGAGLALSQKGNSGSADSLNTAVASVNSTLHPLSFLEFSAGYKNRMAPARDTDPNDLFDTSTAKVALSPLKSVHLIGTYAQNPDDDGINVQRLARKGIGLETSLGAVGLSGGYDWSRNYDTPAVQQAIHADLGLRFSQATLLTVGFQTSQNALDPAASQSTAYTVGFSHAFSDRFSLSFNGKRRQSSAAPSDYDASANLGMKF